MTLAAAAVVPFAMAPDGPDRTPRPVRGAAAGAPVAAADQIRAREWHLETVRAERAWKWSTGQDVTVAVLDTGVDANHPDLVGSVVNGPDLTGGGRPPGTRYWGLHGTSMASIIAGHGHGRAGSEGIIGVAPQSRVLSIRVTLENDDPLRREHRREAGDGDAIAQGIRYAVDHGADIINMSLGGGQQYYNGTPAQASAIRYALNRGVVLIASAGNDGSTANRKNFPAAYPGVIAVGALDRRLRLWEDSNRHSHVSVCAPGVDIVSADNGKGYVVGTGTSASSAIVAGVAALVRARYPKLTPDEVRRALVQGSPARPGHPTGFAGCPGTVDAVRTLLAAHSLNKVSTGPVQTPTPVPTPEPVAEPEGEGTGMLLPLVLGGGGVLLLVGVTLGWRQRGRREDDDEETMPEYGLPGPPPDPVPRSPARPPAAAPPSGGDGPPMAPVNAPLWQNNQVAPPSGYTDPGAPVRFDPPPTPGAPPPDVAPPPVRFEPRPPPHPSGGPAGPDAPPVSNGHDFGGANVLDGTARNATSETNGSRAGGAAFAGDGMFTGGDPHGTIPGTPPAGRMPADGGTFPDEAAAGAPAGGTPLGGMPAGRGTFAGEAAGGSHAGGAPAGEALGGGTPTGGMPADGGGFAGDAVSSGDEANGTAASGGRFAGGGAAGASRASVDGTPVGGEFAGGSANAPGGVGEDAGTGEDRGAGEIPIFDDEAWERFRRSALGGTGVRDASPRPAVPTPLPAGGPEPGRPPATPGEAPRDGAGPVHAPSGTTPAAPDGPAGRGEAAPGDEEEYRPPWW
ncbi:S8 family peptidase [Actinomadura sediminis]|uniref:S8 family serine peptidase n=1 Tax=Actinomadura sediminis TaxID=1038904 RepID=A0ABW3ESL5_9ACTN